MDRMNQLQTLVLFLVSTITKLSSMGSNSQNYDLKLVYIQFPSLRHTGMEALSVKPIGGF